MPRKVSPILWETSFIRAQRNLKGFYFLPHLRVKVLHCMVMSTELCRMAIEGETKEMGISSSSSPPVADGSSESVAVIMGNFAVTDLSRDTVAVSVPSTETQIVLRKPTYSFVTIYRGICNFAVKAMATMTNKANLTTGKAQRVAQISSSLKAATRGEIGATRAA